jgi:hypothetical protein
MHGTYLLPSTHQQTPTRTPTPRLSRCPILQGAENLPLPSTHPSAYYTVRAPPPGWAVVGFTMSNVSPILFSRVSKDESLEAQLVCLSSSTARFTVSYNTATPLAALTLAHSGRHEAGLGFEFQLS